MMIKSYEILLLIYCRNSPFKFSPQRKSCMFIIMMLMLFSVCAKAFSKVVYKDICGIYALERQKFLVVLMTDKRVLNLQQ